MKLKYVSKSDLLPLFFSQLGADAARQAANPRAVVRGPAPNLVSPSLHALPLSGSGGLGVVVIMDVIGHFVQSVEHGLSIGLIRAVDGKVDVALGSGYPHAPGCQGFRVACHVCYCLKGVTVDLVCHFGFTFVSS